MDESVLDAIVRHAEEISRKRANVDDLQQQKLQVSSEIEQKELEHSAAAKIERARVFQEKQSTKKDFQEKEQQLEQELQDVRDKEQQLERQLQELRDQRKDYEYNKQQQLDNVATKSDSAMSLLHAKKQNIEDRIAKDQEWLQHMQQRYSSGFGRPVSTDPKPELAPNPASIAARSTPTRLSPSSGSTRTDEKRNASRLAQARKKIRSMSDDFPTVVCVRGKWREIACFICNTNVARDHGNFFKGWANLRQHLLKAHRSAVTGQSDRYLLNACIKRSFDEADVQRLRKGRQPEEGGPISKLRKNGGRALSRLKEKDSLTSKEFERCSKGQHEAVEKDDNEDRRHDQRHSAVVTQQSKTGSEGSRPILEVAHWDDVSVSDMGLGDEEDEGDVSGAPGNIIPYGAEFARIKCKYCGANANHQTRDHFDGLDDMQDHLLSFHAHDAQMHTSLTHDAVLGHCEVEKLSVEQLEMLDRGEIPNEMVYPPVVNQEDTKEGAAEKLSTQEPVHDITHRVERGMEQLPSTETNHVTQTQTATRAAVMASAPSTPQPRELRASLSSINRNLDLRFADRQQWAKSMSTPPSAQGSFHAPHQDQDRLGSYSSTASKPGIHRGGQKRSPPTTEPPLDLRYYDYRESPSFKRFRHDA